MSILQHLVTFHPFGKREKNPTLRIPVIKNQLENEHNKNPWSCKASNQLIIITNFLTYPKSPRANATAQKLGIPLLITCQQMQNVII